MFILSYCESKDIKILNNENLRISKRIAAYIIVSIDFIVLLVTIFGTNLILYMMKDFVNKYDIQTVEARDFTVVVNKLP